MEVSEDDCDRFDTAGSWPLFNELYIRDAKYRKAIEAVYSDEAAFPREIFNYDEIQDIWHSFLNGDLNLLFEVNSLITFGALNHQFSCLNVS